MSVQHLSLPQKTWLCTSIVCSVVSAIVGLTVQFDDSKFLACYIVFLLSDAALAAMLLIWRKRLHPFLGVIAWLWVSIGFLILVIDLGVNSGLLRE